MFLLGYGDYKICIDHPNNIFANKLVSKGNIIIDEIDWTDIDLINIFSIKNNNPFVDEVNEQININYCLNKLENEIQNLVKKGREKEATRYLVIVQSDYKGNYLVRGIIKGVYKEGFSIAFNKDYLNSIPYKILNDYSRLIGDDKVTDAKTLVKRL